MNTSRDLLVGVDIGGTFTDFVIYDRDSSAFHLHKLLTNPDDPAQCVIDGLRELIGRLECQPNQLALVIHGTTLITNSLIERNGAETALLTTRGHRDVLESGTEMRYDPYNLFIEKPKPLVPRHRRHTVNERLAASGSVVRPIDSQELKDLAGRLQDQGIDSVAICFLHAFTNSIHEREAATLLRKLLPHLSISLSSEVAPEIREYQRTSTTVANAYVKPLAKRYLNRLATALQAIGYGQPLYLMLSSGGITVEEFASQFPIHLLESGPAGGVLFASFLGRLLDRSHVVSFDMGGTTAKMSYVENNQPIRTRTFEVARVARFKLGSGLPIQVPVIEMMEIGAGGGSIAHKDKLGLLKVGPASAGAVPGPACYGRGGTQPTVTDADLLLGYLSPDNFLGGRMPLRRDLAEDAVRRHAAEPLGLDLIQAARGIFDVVNQNMVAATKVHVAERGKDPRRATLVAFGGAGPVHAHALAEALNLREIICPLRAGTASALGFLTAPISFEFARSLTSLLDELEPDILAETFRVIEERGYEALRQAGIQPEEMHFARSIDMRHAGQGRHEIDVALPDGPVDGRLIGRLPELFFEAYQRLYEQTQTDVPIETVTCRVVASGPDSDVVLPTIRAGGRSAQQALRGTRDAHFSEAGGFVETALYDRYALGAGVQIDGPAIVEENESTVVIPPSMTATVDEFGNLLLTPLGGT